MIVEEPFGYESFSSNVTNSSLNTSCFLQYAQENGRSIEDRSRRRLGKEAQRVAEFLKIIYALDETPLENLDAYITVCIKILKSLDVLELNLQVNMEYLESVIAFLSNNRLKYIMERIVLEAVSKFRCRRITIQEQQGIGFIAKLVQKVYMFDSICGHVIDHTLSASVLEAVINTRARYLAANSRTEDYKLKNFTVISTTVLNNCCWPPSIQIFDVLILCVESIYINDDEQAKYMVQNIGVFFANLYQHHSEIDVSILSELKIAALALVMAALNLKYQRCNGEVMEIVQNQFEVIFGSPLEYTLTPVIDKHPFPDNQYSILAQHLRYPPGKQNLDFYCYDKKVDSNDLAEFPRRMTPLNFELFHQKTANNQSCKNNIEEKEGNNDGDDNDNEIDNKVDNKVDNDVDNKVDNSINNYIDNENGDGDGDDRNNSSNESSSEVELHQGRFEPIKSKFKYNFTNRYFKKRHNSTGPGANKKSRWHIFHKA
ncbi:predicted protein [Lodderomyces elongisporus NRRL YB-4239]|uniref:Uncharacterized protein n=1 Tax=Lodderomyces elongisporus (strain ATCC 11503 / CBS 2605 / JCM 1781 / NBRC 1676 / NRRL YB-4239) TaxID=379508 RepID=A5E757_LODEL|nr:predicted protein [Lodderomyces elongisporus NRRL YB-4239]